MGFFSREYTTANEFEIPSERMFPPPKAHNGTWFHEMYQSSETFRKHHQESQRTMKIFAKLVKEKFDELDDNDFSIDAELQLLWDKATELASKNTEQDKRLNELDESQLEQDKKLEELFKYFEEDEDKNLSIKYLTFPLLYNSEYVSEVLPKVSVDILSGIVYCDLRMRIKKAIPSGTYIIMAKTPTDYMPTLSSPASFLVRKRIYVESLERYEPQGEPQMKQGIGVYSHTYIDERDYGRVVMKPLDDIEVDDYVYLNAMYFLKKGNVGRMDLSNDLEEHDEFKLQENLTV